MFIVETIDPNFGQTLVESRGPLRCPTSISSPVYLVTRILFNPRWYEICGCLCMSLLFATECLCEANMARRIREVVFCDSPKHSAINPVFIIFGEGPRAAEGLARRRRAFGLDGDPSYVEWRG